MKTWRCRTCRCASGRAGITDVRARALCLRRVRVRVLVPCEGARPCVGVGLREACVHTCVHGCACMAPVSSGSGLCPPTSWATAPAPAPCVCPRQPARGDTSCCVTQARVRMVVSYLFAQLSLWARGARGGSLVLGSANVDERCVCPALRHPSSPRVSAPRGGISRLPPVLTASVRHTWEGHITPRLRAPPLPQDVTTPGIHHDSGVQTGQHRFPLAPAPGPAPAAPAGLGLFPRAESGVSPRPPPPPSPPPPASPPAAFTHPLLGSPAASSVLALRPVFTPRL